MNNPPGAKFCSQCAAALDGSGSVATDHEGMGGAEALAYAGEKTALWSQDTVAGYAMDRRALDELEAEGKGDSDAADIARRGIAIAKAKWIVGGIVAVIAIIIFISIASHMGSQPSP